MCLGVCAQAPTLLQWSAVFFDRVLRHVLSGVPAEQSAHDCFMQLLARNIGMLQKQHAGAGGVRMFADTRNSIRHARRADSILILQIWILLHKSDAVCV